MSTTTSTRQEKIKQAQEYLRASIGEKEMKIDRDAVYSLAANFQFNSDFSYARRLFQLLHRHFPQDEKITEKLAVCTYKDTDLSSEVKYDVAAKLLLTNFEEEGKVTNPNVLGVLGSIFKKKWKYDNHTGHLYQSLRYYLEGYQQAVAAQKDDVSDIGYCGINLAFVYDLLARLETFQVRHDEVGYSTKFTHDPFEKTNKDHSQLASKYRADICKAYAARYEVLQAEWEKDKAKKQAFDEGGRYWFFMTWAEALLGLGEFDEACGKFAMALQKGNIPAWQIGAARLQCYEMSELLYGSNPVKMERAKQAMTGLLDDGKTPEDQNIKYGLALSGGGFRASLFHIGVLAKLAEADLLRKIEVISCVSGGSILGAYYYLKLKKLIEEKPQDSLTKQDYINLVIELEKEFLDKVNKNVRLNILANFSDNIKMALSGSYTRSSRTAFLYDKFLYNDMLPRPKEEPDKPRRIFMEDLLISPGGNKKFRPGRHNWQMHNKVPILILNATTLNTGHSWQFTATWMGESPAYIDSEFDALPNLRRMYYWEAPGTYKKIPLSTAVTASAGVPGLFAPIVFDQLYEKNTKVLLVDGGVHDNQGISTLYEQECNVLIISDASGQMPEAKKPPSSEVGVFGRTNSILQERIRYSQFKDLEARKQSGLVRDYLLMHLTKGLPSEVINWKYCDDPYVPPISKENVNESSAIMTDYLIRKKLQTLIARIRTDLDAFHESEACALMYSGYKMTAHEIKLAPSRMLNVKEDHESEKACCGWWKFMRLNEVHDDSELNAKLEEKLEPSSSLFGKVFQLSKPAKYVAGTLALAIVLGLLMVLLKALSPDDISMMTLLKYAGIIMAIIAAERFLSRLLGTQSIAICFFIWTPVLLVLWLVSYVVGLFSTGWYLGVGKLPGTRKE